MTGRARLPLLKSRIRAQPVSRITPIEIPVELVNSELAERKALYRSKRWRDLRARMLATRCKRCFFCRDMTPADVLEHMVGHGQDAGAVARALGIPDVSESWRERFWIGPFCGSCQRHARERAGYETAGRLLAFTEAWLADRSS